MFYNVYSSFHTNKIARYHSISKSGSLIMNETIQADIGRIMCSYL